MYSWISFSGITQVNTILKLAEISSKHRQTIEKVNGFDRNIKRKFAEESVKAHLSPELSVTGSDQLGSDRQYN